jgi:PEP-CTERM motif
MQLRSFATIAFLLLVSPFVHADTISSFLFSATFADGSASGIIGIDTTTGTVESQDIVATISGGTYDFNGLAGQGIAAPTYIIQLYTAALPTEYLQIAIPDISSLVGYAGGTLCSGSNVTPCITAANPGAYYPTLMNIDGNLDIASVANLAPVPEPSSLALLSTGILGTATMLRRRISRS